jgi:DNA-binding winged helix-turn-helix (wHTH) protein
MGTRYTFGDYVLDRDLYALDHCGQKVPLTPKAFDLLVYLIQHRKRVVSRDELMAAVWSGIAISDPTLDASISEARRAVGDSGKTQQVISNVHGRGYRFIAVCIEDDSTLAPAEGQRSAALQGTLDLRIWEPGNPERQDRSLEARGMLPLQPEDLVHLTVEMNAPAYLYLLWIDAQGQLIPLFPWRPGQWAERPPHEEPLQTVRLPEDAHGWPLGGGSGIETLLLLARATPLPAEGILPAALEPLPCEEEYFLKPRWYENWLPKARAGDRTLVVSRPQPLPQKAPDRHDVLQHHLAAHFAYSLAVSFPYQGEGADRVS